MNAIQRRQLRNRTERMALRERIIAALLQDAPILRLTWRTVIGDIQQRTGCTSALACEALQLAHERSRA
jgi:hypothetical protein